jgi:hypothetical protein
MKLACIFLCQGLDAFNNRIVDFAFLDLLYGANYTYGGGTGVSSPGLVSSNSFLSNPTRKMLDSK